MAHFAKINSDGIVEDVVITPNEKPNEGHDWLVERFGGTWIKTSYNTFAGEHLLGGEPLRKNYAGIGFTYDEERDAFIPPQPYPSWIVNEETCRWEAPVSMPEGAYIWDEETVSWVEVSEETE